MSVSMRSVICYRIPRIAKRDARAVLVVASTLATLTFPFSAVATSFLKRHFYRKREEKRFTVKRYEHQVLFSVFELNSDYCENDGTNQTGAKALQCPHHGAKNSTNLNQK